MIIIGKDRTFVLWSRSIARYKVLEIQLSTFAEWDWFKLQFNWTRKRDHAGIEFVIEIVGIYFHIYLYDTRHWDYDNDQWFTYNA